MFGLFIWTRGISYNKPMKWRFIYIFSYFESLPLGNMDIQKIFHRKWMYSTGDFKSKIHDFLSIFTIVYYFLDLQTFSLKLKKFMQFCINSTKVLIIIFHTEYSFSYLHFIINYIKVSFKLRLRCGTIPLLYYNISV